MKVCQCVLSVFLMTELHFSDAFAIVRAPVNTSKRNSLTSISSFPSPSNSRTERTEVKPLGSSSTVKDAQSKIDSDQNEAKPKPLSIWEEVAKKFVPKDFLTNPEQLRNYVQTVTLLRVGVPSILGGATAGFAYPAMSLFLAAIINDPTAFDVIANDYSQYIQNILTTCGLIFSLLVGQTYYFMYTQQEAVYFALFEEVTVAKSLLEQVALVCQGRYAMYQSILECIDQYVQTDLLQTDKDPAVLLSARPIDDPFERIMFLSSVGEPSVVYHSVRKLRQARAKRLGALQRKLPPIHMVLLWTLAGIVLCTFPLLGAGVQTLGGLGILKIQSWYFALIVFGTSTVLGIVNELSQPEREGAYNVASVLSVMVAGLEEELQGRMSDSGKYKLRSEQFLSPSVDVLSWAYAEETELEVAREEQSKETSDGSTGIGDSSTSTNSNMVRKIARKLRNR